MNANGYAFLGIAFPLGIASERRISPQGPASKDIRRDAFTNQYSGVLFEKVPGPSEIVTFPHIVELEGYLQDRHGNGDIAKAQLIHEGPSNRRLVFCNIYTHDSQQRQTTYELTPQTGLMWVGKYSGPYGRGVTMCHVLPTCQDLFDAGMALSIVRSLAAFAPEKSVIGWDVERKKSLTAAPATVTA